MCTGLGLNSTRPNTPCSWSFAPARRIPKASPLPPAPPAISCLTICSSIDWKNADWQDWNHWKIQQLHISFQADFIYFVSQIYRFFEVLGDHFSSILGLVTPLFHYFGDHWVQGCTQMGPELIFSDFWWILGPPLETILDHFFIFSLIWAVQNHIWIAVTFFADFWMEFLVNSDVLTLHKYCKYWCFH